MSIELMGKIWKDFPSAGGELNCALALADHAKDDGTSIFPSVAELARKTRQSDRTVQRQLRKFEDWRWLICIGNESGGRDKPREYRINPAYIENPGKFSFGLKGDNLSPFSVPERVTADALKGDTVVSRKGDTTVSPEPSLTTKEPSPPTPPRGLFSLADGELRAWFDGVLWPRYPNRAAKTPAFDELRKLNPDSTLLAVILAGLDTALAAERARRESRDFVPAWPHAKRWIRDRRWEDCFDVPRETDAHRCACGAAGVVSQGKRWYCGKCDPLRMEARDGQTAALRG